MPYKDPEAKKEANRLRMQRRRAEGRAWIDPEKEAARKRVWYAEKGGKEKLLKAQRVRRGAALAEKVGKIASVKLPVPQAMKPRRKAG